MNIKQQNQSIIVVSLFYRNMSEYDCFSCVWSEGVDWSKCVRQIYYLVIRCRLVFLLCCMFLYAMCHTKMPKMMYLHVDFIFSYTMPKLFKGQITLCGGYVTLFFSPASQRPGIFNSWILLANHMCCSSLDNGFSHPDPEYGPLWNFQL